MINNDIQTMNKEDIEDKLFKSLDKFKNYVQDEESYIEVFNLTIDKILELLFDAYRLYVTSDSIFYIIIIGTYSLSLELFMSNNIVHSLYHHDDFIEGDSSTSINEVRDHLKSIIHK